MFSELVGLAKGKLLRFWGERHFDVFHDKKVVKQTHNDKARDRPTLSNNL